MYKSILIAFLIISSITSAFADWQALVRCYNNGSESVIFDVSDSACQLVVKNQELKTKIWELYGISENQNGEVIIRCSLRFEGTNLNPTVKGQWGWKKRININYGFDHCIKL